MTIPISLVMTIGPYPHNLRWLDEALESVRAQTLAPDEFIVVCEPDATLEIEGARLVRTATPRIGWPQAMNLGISEARNHWVGMLNSDDRLYPGYIRSISNYVEKYGDKPYHIRHNIVCSEGPGTQGGMVFHKEVWAAVGGFENVFGSDTKFVSKILLSQKFRVVNMEEGDPFYWHRRHAEQISVTGVGWGT